MASTLHVITLVAFVCMVNGLVLVHNVHRRVTKILKVTNGGEYGNWGEPHFCSAGTYAVGYNMKIESNQHGGDDTSLNGIRLECESVDGTYGGDAESSTGPWGTWVGRVSCDKSHVFKSFALQVEGNQHGGDDTEANYVKFMCQTLDGTSQKYEMVHSPGHGLFGSFGAFSDSCGPNEAICGLRTKLEGDQHGGDDTSTNDAEFYCCDD